MKKKDISELTKTQAFNIGVASGKCEPGEVAYLTKDGAVGIAAKDQVPPDAIFTING